jgi:hypothetical protein
MPIRWGIFHPQNYRQVMLATETGIWTTNNIDASPVFWTPNVTGMANVRVDQLNIRTSDNTVVAASHGRGLFTAIWDVEVGIDNLQMKEFSIFPNPVSDQLNISLTSTGSKNIIFRIFDPSGKLLMDEDQGTLNGSLIKHLSVSNLASGVYFISIYEAGKKVRTEKFIKD